MIKFDHEFIGRAALERRADEPHRRKVWLRWNDEDVIKVISSALFGADKRAKYLERPCGEYATTTSDRVMIGDRMVGLSAKTGYSVNVGSWSSLAMIDEDDAKDGAEVTIVWGEENGGSRKPSVERHVQTTIRATLSTLPLV